MADIARTGRPRGSVLERPRLTGAIRGAFRQFPVVALCAPAGMGKSILARQYADSEERPVAWWRMPQSPDDPARLAWAWLRSLHAMVPDAVIRRCEAELADAQGDTEALLRRLRDIVARLGELFPEGWLLVLDDLHHARGRRAALRFVAVMVEALPPRAMLIVTSRIDLAALNVPWRTKAQEFDEAALRFSDAEVHAWFRLARGQHLSAERLAALQEKLHGWPLALAMLSHAGRDPLARLDRADSIEQLATEIFGKLFESLPPGLQGRLPGLALVDEFTPAEAGRQIAWPHWQAELETLAQAGVARRCAEGNDRNTPWSLHPLFATWLASRLDAGDREARRAACVLAGHCLAAQGDGLMAAQRFLEAEQAELAARTLLEAGMRELRRGRYQAILEVTSRLPEPLLRSSAWLLLLHGSAQLEMSRAESDRWLQAAEAQFRREENPHGELLALVQRVHYHGLLLGQPLASLRLLERAEALYARQGSAMEPYALAKIDAYLGIANLMIRAEHDVARRHLLRALGVAEQAGMVNVAVRLRYFLALQKMMLGQYAVVQDDLERLWRDLASPFVTASTRQMALAAFLNWYQLQGEYRTLLAWLDRAAAQAPREGEAVMAFIVKWRAEALDALGRSSDACALLQEALNHPLVAKSELLRGLLLDRLAIARLHNGNREQGMETARKACRLHLRVGDPHQAGYNHISHAVACLLTGDGETASALLEEAVTLAERIAKPQVLAAGRLYQALLALDRGDRAAAQRCFEAFAELIERHGMRACADWQNDLLLPLFERAVTEGWAPSVTRRLLASHWDMAVEEGQIRRRLHLDLLGGVRLGFGETASLSGDAFTARERQILILLAMTPRHVLPVNEILASLWPDSPEDKARRALDTTLARLRTKLRKSLGADAAGHVPLRNGILSLQAVILDADEFAERIRTGLEAARNGHAWRATESLEAGLARYHGPFAADEQALSDIDAHRAGLAELHAGGACTLADLLEAAGRPDEAMHHLDTALRLQPRSPAILRALYRRCCDRGLTARAESLLRHASNVLGVDLHSE